MNELSSRSASAPLTAAVSTLGLLAGLVLLGALAADGVDMTNGRTSASSGWPTTSYGLVDRLYVYCSPSVGCAWNVGNVE